MLDRPADFSITGEEPTPGRSPVDEDTAADVEDDNSFDECDYVDELIVFGGVRLIRFLGADRTQQKELGKARRKQCCAQKEERISYD